MKKSYVFAVGTRFVFSKALGFTLIELLVVVAIVGIIVVSVIITLNPSKRVADAQVTSLKAQVSAVGTAYDLCTNYVDISVSPAVQNALSNCNTIALLTGAIKGAPFLKSTPSGTYVFQAAGTTNKLGCLYSSATIGGTVTYAQFLSSNNSVVTNLSAPTCP